jgi:hypothetical protein
MENQKYAAFEGARPYFQLVRRALGDARPAGDVVENLGTPS